MPQMHTIEFANSGNTALLQLGKLVRILKYNHWSELGAGKARDYTLLSRNCAEFLHIFGFRLDHRQTLDERPQHRQNSLCKLIGACFDAIAGAGTTQSQQALPE